MRETTAFFSTCPRCKHARLQSGYDGLNQLSRPVLVKRSTPTACFVMWFGPSVRGSGS